jgi:metal-responsive CopG/Arc/MetJ family transcriptional regulator
MQAMQPHTLHGDQPKRESTRITVTLPPGDYEAVVRISKSKRVSASWVVRDAVAKYIAAEPTAEQQSIA